MGVLQSGQLRYQFNPKLLTLFCIYKSKCNNCHPSHSTFEFVTQLMTIYKWNKNCAGNTQRSGKICVKGNGVNFRLKTIHQT